MSVEAHIAYLEAVGRVEMQLRPKVQDTIRKNVTGSLGWYRREGDNALNGCLFGDIEVQYILSLMDYFTTGLPTLWYNGTLPLKCLLQEKYADLDRLSRGGIEARKINKRAQGDLYTSTPGQVVVELEEYQQARAIEAERMKILPLEKPKFLLNTSRNASFRVK